MKLKLLDCIALSKDLPGQGLREGDVGTVVEVYDREWFEVEFIDEAGNTLALLTLNARDLRPVAAKLGVTPSS